MTRFLSPERQQQLIVKLTEMGMALPGANQMSSIEDDMHEVDLTMLAHVEWVVHYRNLGNFEESVKGVVCLETIMEEAMERGFAETDFPLSLAAIKTDLSGRGIEVQ